MSSNLRVNNIFPSVGTNVAIGTAGGSITLTGSTTGDITSSGVSTFSNIRVTGGTISGVSTAGITTAYIGSVNDGPISGARNRIINGDMRIDQRNAGASVTTNSSNSQYAPDRWQSRIGQATAAMTVQQSTVAPAGFTTSVLLTVSNTTAPAAGDRVHIRQIIEGFNIDDLGWGTASAKTITLSFWVRSSVIGTYGVGFINSAENRSYVGTYAINSANTFEYKTITVPGDTTGTWLTNNSNGIRVTFDLGSGSTYNASSANTWVAQEACRTSGCVNFQQNSGATWYLTGVQLESGTVATPFERRSYGQELALCQRYYAKSYKQSVVPGANDGDGCSVFYSHTSGTYTINGNIIFPVEMRAEPTVSIWSNSGTSGQFTASDSVAKSGSASAISQRQASMNVTSGNNNVTYRCQWVAAIEL